MKKLGLGLLLGITIALSINAGEADNGHEIIAVPDANGGIWVMDKKQPLIQIGIDGPATYYYVDDYGNIKRNN